MNKLIVRNSIKDELFQLLLQRLRRFLAVAGRDDEHSAALFYLPFSSTKTITPRGNKQRRSGTPLTEEVNFQHTPPILSTSCLSFRSTSCSLSIQHLQTTHTNTEKKAAAKARHPGRAQVTETTVFSISPIALYSYLSIPFFFSILQSLYLSISCSTCSS